MARALPFVAAAHALRVSPRRLEQLLDEHIDLDVDRDERGHTVVPAATLAELRARRAAHGAPAPPVQSSSNSGMPVGTRRQQMRAAARVLTRELVACGDPIVATFAEESAEVRARHTPSEDPEPLLDEKERPAQTTRGTGRHRAQHAALSSVRKMLNAEGLLSIDPAYDFALRAAREQRAIERQLLRDELDSRADALEKRESEEDEIDTRDTALEQARARVRAVDESAQMRTAAL